MELRLLKHFIVVAGELCNAELARNKQYENSEIHPYQGARATKLV
jgi:hypothetical protein